MKILSATQLHELDQYTIANEPIRSIDLMERASMALVGEIKARWNKDIPVKIFAGPGNNGGDALAVARLLSEGGFSDIKVYLFNIGDSLSEDCEQNRQRLLNCPKIDFEEITTQFTPPKLTEKDLVIDGLFGTGLSRPLNGGFASVVKYLNSMSSTIVSIDVPSGLMCEDNTLNVMNHVVKANYTFTFQRPKLAFLFPENEQYVGEWKVLDIGIKDVEDEAFSTPYHLTERTDVSPLLHKRSRFAHKGTMGHAVLVAGSKGMAGAAVLSAKACLKSGVGKLSVHTPECNVPILQVAVPEAVMSVDSDLPCFENTFDMSEYDAIAIGPGIGTIPATAQAFIEQINLTKCPVVIDADALNILGSHRGWINQLPRMSILTPHPKELFGLISTTRNSFEQLERTRELAQRQQIFIVIKGAFSAICCPDGNVYFNTTGNPGMATAGSGDVLTGILLALVAQDYKQEEAARLGVYLHGLAGDLAAEEMCEESVTASDIIEYIGKAFKTLKSL